MHPERAVFLVESCAMFATFGYIFGSAFWYRPRRRLFHYLTSQVCMIAGITHACLFLGIGRLTTAVGTRFDLVRYVDWLMTTPLQLIALGTIGQISMLNIYALAFMDMAMIIAGGLGEWVVGTARWLFFTLGGICFLPLYIFLFEDLNPTTMTSVLGEQAVARYYAMGRYLLSVWFFYPLVWILYNTSVISDLTQSLLMCALDALSKIGCSLWMIASIRKSGYLLDTAAVECHHENGY